MVLFRQSRNLVQEPVLNVIYPQNKNRNHQEINHKNQITRTKEINHKNKSQAPNKNPKLQVVTL
jgi:hypothetical protein